MLGGSGTTSMEDKELNAPGDEGGAPLDNSEELYSTQDDEDFGSFFDTGSGITLPLSAHASTIF